MKVLFWLELMLALAGVCVYQSSSLVIDVVEVKSGEEVTLTCNVSSSTNLTRWTYLSISNGTSLMSFQNGKCTVSPSDSFLNNGTIYSYTCNNTVYQITTQTTALSYIKNRILACRDAFQPDESGSTWMIKFPQNGEECSYCESTTTFDEKVINEKDNVTFVCKVSSGVTYVNWNRNFGSSTASMDVQYGRCRTPTRTTFLDNTSKYIYTCNSTVYQVIKLNVQRSEHNDMYMCTPPSMLEGKGSNWIIKINAPVTSVTMTPANNMVDVIENAFVNFSCTTSTARPDASVYWYLRPNGINDKITQIRENITTTTDYNDLSVTTSILRLVPTIQHNNTNIFCTANNYLNTNQVMSDRTSLLNVLYIAEDPFIIQGNAYRMIASTSETLSCTVKGGNPTPTLSWSCNNFSPTNHETINSNGNINTTLTWTALRSHDGICTCTSQQTGFRNKSIHIVLNVLYPPSKPVLSINDDSVVGYISFLEGTARNIACTADSKPSPHIYTWTGPSIADPLNIQTLIFNDTKRHESGQYKCSVKNIMNPSKGGLVVGINSTVVNVIILYPPVVKPMYNVSVLNGKQLNINCEFSAGIPASTWVKWTRDVDNSEWNTVGLNMLSLNKNDTGMYTCTAYNVMVASGDNQSYIGQHNQSFYLDVLYKATVTSLTTNGDTSETKTVNEGDTVRLNCDAYGNPTAVTTLGVGRKTLVNVTSNSVKYTITNVVCLDAGTYYCSANNIHNKKEKINRTVQLYVNCYPRVAGVIDMNITSEEDESITIVLNVVAYPQPSFTWYKLVDDNWKILHDDDKYDIKSSNIQSNLTLHSVAMDDFTSYKVNVVNDLGQMEHLFFLSPYDKPDPPTQFRHIESYSTTSSIHLEWSPGFDNGQSQTFYIKYKVSSDTTWNYQIVSDNGEQTMELTLTELTEDTEYYIVIFASNEKGHSSESQVLVARTKGIESTQTRGPLIGSVIGATIGLAIIVALLAFVCKRKGFSVPLTRTKRDDVNNSAEQHVYYNADSVPVYETISRNNEEPSPYSTLDQTEGCTTSESRGEEKKDIYENLKIQVF